MKRNNGVFIIPLFLLWKFSLFHYSAQAKNYSLPLDKIWLFRWKSGYFSLLDNLLNQSWRYAGHAYVKLWSGKVLFFGKLLALISKNCKWFEPRSHHMSVNYDRPGECSPEKDCLWWHWLTFRQPEQKSSSESSLMSSQVLTLMMTSAQVVETSVNVITNSPSQDYNHLDDHNLPTGMISKNC